MKQMLMVFCVALLFSSVLVAGPFGEELWSYETGFIIHSSPAIAPDGTIYIGSHDDCLHAVNPDGTGKWKFQTNGDISSSPAIGKDGTIYFGSKDGRLYAVNPDGTEKWHYQTGAKITASPAIGKNGMVYIGSRDCYFYAFNPEGELKWVYDTGGVIYSSPAIAQDGTVYIASDSYQLFAFEPDGTQKWSFELERSPYIKSSELRVKSSPALGPDGTIYMSSSYNWLYAINPDGSVKWEKTLYGYSVYTPAVDRNGNIYIYYRQNYSSNYWDKFMCIIVFTANGEKKWDYRTRDDHRFTIGEHPYHIWCSPLMDRNGNVYIFFRKQEYLGGAGHIEKHDKVLLRVFNESGEKIQECKFAKHNHNGKFGYILGSPKIDENGVLYFGWLDHKLHAIQTESYGMDWSSWPCFGQNLESTHRDDGIYGPVVSTDEESPEVAFEDSNNDDVIFSAVEDPSAQPSTFSLSQNYPNPFNNQTQIQYQLPQNTFVSLKIFNTMGKAVQELVNEVQTSGVYQVHWNGLDQLGNHVPSGMYFVELKAGDYREMRKMMLVE